MIQEKEAHLEKLDQKYKKKLQQRQQNQDVKKSSYVQVLNLKNTSVYEPPEGFYVVKEKKVDFSHLSNIRKSEISWFVSLLAIFLIP